MADETEVERIERLAHAALSPGRVKAGDRSVFQVVPDGYKVVDLECYQDGPNTKSGTFKAHSTEFLVKYAEQYCADGGHQRPAAFIDEGSRKIELICDYGGQGSWGHAVHRCVFSAEVSRKLRLWFPDPTDAKTVQMGQKDLGEFLQDRASMIEEPDAASVIEACMNLKIERKVTFEKATNLRNGVTQFVYSENDSGERGSIALPSIVKIRAPIFRGSQEIPLALDLRYRMKEGLVTFHFACPGLSLMMDEEFERLAHTFRDDVHLSPSLENLKKAIFDGSFNPKGSSRV